MISLSKEHSLVNMNMHMLLYQKELGIHRRQKASTSRGNQRYDLYCTFLNNMCSVLRTTATIKHNTFNFHKYFRHGTYLTYEAILLRVKFNKSLNRKVPSGKNKCISSSKLLVNLTKLTILFTESNGLYTGFGRYVAYKYQFWYVYNFLS